MRYFREIDRSQPRRLMTLGIIRDDVLASVETAIEGEPDERYFHRAVREAVADLLTPLSK